MRTIYLNDRNVDPIIFTQLGSTAIAVYRGCEKMGTISLPEPGIDFSVTYDNGWNFWCLTETGCLYYHSERGTAKASEVPLEQNQEIFGDLLGNGTGHDLQLSLSSEPVIQLTTNHVIVKIDISVTAVCAQGDCVMIIAWDSAGYYTHLYKQKNLLSQSSSHRTITGYIFFPYTMPVLCETQTDLDIATLFVIISDAMESEYSPSTSSQCLRISGEFFDRLFSSEVALMNSSVILFCPPNGSVYFTPAKSVSAQGVPSSSWKILCHTSQKVVNIHKIKIPSKITVESDDIQRGKLENLTEGLLFCAKNGKCSLIFLSEKHGIKFDSCLLPAPLIASGYYGDKIYHSTGRDLIETSLSLSYTSGEWTFSAQNSVFLTCGNVRDLVCLKNPVSKEGTCDSLLCRLGDNKIKVVEVSTKSNLQACPRTFSNKRGGRIKDLLICLENTTTKRKQISLLSSQINHCLLQLSIAAFLTRAACSSEHPIKCTVTIKHERTDISNYQPIVSCVLLNQGPFQLSSDWSILLTTSDSNCWSSTKAANLNNEWKPKETVEVSLPINVEVLYHSLIKVQVFICLKMSEAVLKHLPHTTIPEWDKGCLCVAIHECIVDVFHFMGMASDSLKLGKKMDERTADVLLKMAETRPMGQNVKKTNKNASDTIKIHISLDSVVSSKQTKRNKKDLSILRLILKNSHVGLDQICDNSLNLGCVTTDWKMHLEVKTTDEQGEITVRAPVAVAAMARQAILQRLQLEQTTDSKALRTCVPTVKVGQDFLSQIELLKKKVQMLKDSSSSKTIKDRSNRDCITPVYEKLRHSSYKFSPNYIQ